MLLDFRVSNHRSLKDEQDLDLRAVYRKDEKSVRVAAIYGANASGKSNVLHALRFMHDTVTDQDTAWRASGGERQQPFLLDSESKRRPSNYAVDILVDGVRYSYGFGVSGDLIVDEWLFSYPKGRKVVLFDRSGGKYRTGRTLNSPKIQLLQDLTPDDGLFLLYAARAKIEAPQAVYDWFHQSLWFTSDERTNVRLMRSRTLRMLGDPENSERIQRLIKAADFGISRIERRVNDVVFERVPVEDLAEPNSVRIKTDQDVTRVLYTGDEPPVIPAELLSRPRSILFEHAGAEVAKLPFEEESRGTRAWFEAAGYVLAALDHGWTLVVDELDTSLHPLLLAQLVRLFQGPGTNPEGAQLVFTTHDSSLLGRHGGEELLRRDEIWLVEKNELGESLLFPLTDFKPRDGLNWERRYLGGSIGAVPFVLSDELAEAAVPAGKGADE
ncbi:AAA family ATPase [Kitasatospora sp. NPDC002551]|uniref:AAA family ATPase n=1 Tax=unclassified Kitasatospora TaxID=2633591 RepID=UPI00331FEF61